jgi:hypothetical protein
MIIYADFTSAYCYLASLRLDRLMAAGHDPVDWRAVEHRPGLPRPGLHLNDTARLIRGRELAATRCLLTHGEEFKARNPRCLPNTRSASAAYARARAPRLRRSSTSRHLRRLLGARTAHRRPRRGAAPRADHAVLPTPVPSNAHRGLANGVVEPAHRDRPHHRLRTPHRMRPCGPCRAGETPPAHRPTYHPQPAEEAGCKGKTFDAGRSIRTPTYAAGDLPIGWHWAALTSIRKESAAITAFTVTRQSGQPSVDRGFVCVAAGASIGHV